MHDPNVCAPSRFRQRPQMPEKYFFVLRAIRTCALLRDPGSNSRCQKNTIPYHFQSERMRCFPLRLHPHCIRAWGEKKKYIYIYIIFPLPNPHISFHIPLHILLPSRSFVRVRALEMYITFLSNFWADMHIESECDGVHHASKSLPGGSLVRWASQGFGPFFARPSPRLQSVAFV